MDGARRARRPLGPNAAPGAPDGAPGGTTPSGAFASAPGGCNAIAVGEPFAARGGSHERRAESRGGRSGPEAPPGGDRGEARRDPPRQERRVQGRAAEAGADHSGDPEAPGPLNLPSGVDLTAPATEPRCGALALGPTLARYSP